MLDAILKALGIRRAGSPPDAMQAPYGDVPAMPAPIAAPAADVAPAPRSAPVQAAPAPTPAPASKPKRKTLAGVVGVAVAGALFTAVPAEESGRTVEVTIEEPDAAPVVKHISGKQYLKAYLDIVGVPTACDGITKGVRMGQTYTEAQCTELLEHELIVHAEGVMKCTPGLALSSDPIVEDQRAGPRFAAVSLAYNVGVGRKATANRKGAGYCGSTVARRFNEYRYELGCDALLMWNKAGGREVKGLTNRRKRERTVCLKGL